jgi:hypothetical protein
MNWRLASILVLAGGLLCAVFFFLPRRDPVRHVLPDGSAITLVAVKAGAQHFAPMASFKQQLAARLPASWNQRLKLSPPPSTYCQFFPSNYLSVWLLAEKPNSAGPPRFDLLLGDEDGSFTCHAEHHGQGVSVPLGPGQWLVGLPVAAWPRRADFINIQVFLPTHPDKRLTEFRVKNPGRDQRTPAWEAQPWPITVRDGDLDFTLTSLWLGLGSFHGYKDRRLWAAKEPNERSTRATFRVTRGDEVLTNWLAYHVRTIRDATGNWSDGNSFSSAIQNGETFNQFGRPPLPAREAWRLTMEFSRVSGFETGEVYVVRGVAVPPNGSGGTETNALGPHRIEVRWEPKRSDSSDPPGFWATVSPTKSDHKLTLISAKDNRGRNVPCKNHGGGQSVTAEYLTLEPDATSVDLVFAFHRSRLVTFQVKPEFYRP